MTAMNFFYRIWHLAGNIYLTMGIIGCMAVDLIWGYCNLKTHMDMFAPINKRGFIAWAATWGSESLSITLWLFILVGLMALLSVNTFVCTTDRVITLIRFRRRFSSFRRFFFKFGPHVMHYAMLVMFLGYLVSYLYAGTHLGKVLLPGKPITVDRISITLKDLHIDYYDGTRMPHFQNRAIRAQATLLFSDLAVDLNADLSAGPLEEGTGNTLRTLTDTCPALFRGHSVHLRGFEPRYNPATMSGMSMGGGRTYINITVKKDPGMKFYFTGMVFFVLGLIMYTTEKIFIKKPVKSVSAVPGNAVRRPGEVQ